MMPKNRAENIQGILRYFSNKNPSPSEKAKVTANKRNTSSIAKNLQKTRFLDNSGLKIQVLFSFIAPSEYCLKGLGDAYNFFVEK